MVIKSDDNEIFIESQGTNIWQPVLCISNTLKAYQNDRFVSGTHPFRLFIKILGLCSSSSFDYRFVCVMDDKYVWVRRLGSEIRFIEDGNWKFTSETYMKGGFIN